MEMKKGGASGSSFYFEHPVYCPPHTTGQGMLLIFPDHSITDTYGGKTSNDGLAVKNGSMSIVGVEPK